MEIGKIIKKCRTEKELTQEDLATVLFVSRQLISKWENGKSYPDLNQLIQLSDYFDLSLDELMRGDKIMKTTMIKSNKRKHNLIKILSVVVFLLSIMLLKNYSNQVSIEFQKTEVPPSLEAEPFKQEEIKEISVKDNIVSITFQSSLESTFFGYFADGGGGEATISLYKKKVPDDDSLKYEGRTEIDLSTMPKIKKLFVNIQ